MGSADRHHLEGAPVPDWYRDAVIYEVHVRAFADSNGDGIGDFDGLTGRLDYLQQLGVTALWLLPFYPSPLRDDGYDIADYEGVHPAYGDRASFRRFLREAHRRGLRVITELVVNHTSDAHPWFQRARRAPAGSRWRDWYVWSDDAKRYAEARIIFSDYESSNWTWDIEAGAYFWHRFYSHQPDLNFDNPEVRRALLRVLDRWLELGVDGLRLDAVPYLYEREGTNCENLPETHQFLRELRAHVDARFPNRMLLAEANQWPEDAVAYFGDGDECHMAFHFPLMPRLFMALQMESRHPVVDILEQTPPIPTGSQWAMFLRNHDELTLEMVTDEERDYMYRRYAADPRMRVNLGIRRRLAPLLDNDRRKIELLNVLLFSLPGTPVVYYGDEIGMGDNVYLGDREGVRTPMQWSADRNAGFSRANPHQLYLPVNIDPSYHYESLNVEAQQRDPTSLWWWMHNLIALRRRNPVFGRGHLEMLDPDNPKVLAYLRTPADGAGDSVLVVANLSRHAQQASINLPHHSGSPVVELFGGARFAAVGDDAYRLSLAPYGYYWLSLGARERQVVRAPQRNPSFVAAAGIDDLLDGAPRRALEARLVQFLATQRWFAAKSRTIKSVAVEDAIPVPTRSESAITVLVLRVDFQEGEATTYTLPVTVVRGGQLDDVCHHRPHQVIAPLGPDGVHGALCDAVAAPAGLLGVADLVVRGGSARGEHGRLVGRPVRGERQRHDGTVPVRVLGGEQSNSSLVIDERVILKFRRRVEAGIDPDAELGRHLAEVAFPHVPAFVGSLQHEQNGSPPRTVATMTRFVPNQGDLWADTLDELSRFFEQVAAHGREGPLPEDLPDGRLTLGATQDAPDRLLALAGGSLALAGLLGERTAELHSALARGESESLRPERFSRLYQRGLEQSLRTEWRETQRVLALARDRLEASDAVVADRLRAREPHVLRRFAALRRSVIDVCRIRIHGDLHLGQVLSVDGDVMFIDFEGEPSRPVGERRIKRSALRDVAGILRSYDYASRQGLRDALDSGLVAGLDIAPLTAWARLWRDWHSRAFVAGYRREAKGSVHLPVDEGEQELLLELLLVQKAAYEIRYELDNRPDWVGVPLLALDELTTTFEEE